MNRFVVGLGRYLLPILIFISVIYLLRGHNSPGGGFIAGLITGMSIIFKGFYRRNPPFLNPRYPFKIISGGLILALFSGLPSVIMGDSFMQAIWGPSLSLPIVGKVAIGTVFFFDIGVYIVILGLCFGLVELLRPLGGADDY